MKRTPLLRKSPLRAMSLKRRRALPARKACREIVIARQGGRCALPYCGELATDVHEIRSRAQGGSITDPANCLGLCSRCHALVHDNPKRAAELGLLLSRKWGVA